MTCALCHGGSARLFIQRFLNAAEERKELPKNPEAKVDGKGTAPVGLVISCDMDDDISVSEFISNYKNNDLSREEIIWACCQFDNMAERTGADIRGMLVNGKPTLDLSLNGTKTYEQKAKCALRAAALDGQRISAVPVHESGMPDPRKTPTPVRVLDNVEQTKSLWEGILEFFGLGRSNRIKEALLLLILPFLTNCSIIISARKHSSRWSVILCRYLPICVIMT